MGWELITFKQLFKLNKADLLVSPMTLNVAKFSRVLVRFKFHPLGYLNGQTIHVAALGDLPQTNASAMFQPTGGQPFVPICIIGSPWPLRSLYTVVGGQPTNTYFADLYGSGSFGTTRQQVI